MKFHIQAIAVAALVATACGGGGGDGSTNPPPNQVLGSITATPATLPLTAGGTASITARALDEAGSLIAGASGFTYQPSDNTVVEVSSSGNVLALKAGPADITVSLTRGGVTKSAVVHVTVTGTLPTFSAISAGANLAFEPDRVVIAAGGTVTFSAGSVAHNVTFGGGNGAPDNIPSGTQWQVNRTFPVAGDFNFQCTLHPGMNGTVLVR